MQLKDDLSKRGGEHLSIFFIEVEYDLARSLDGVGSNEHVPLDFSGLRPVHCLNPLPFDSLCCGTV
jgi:hypothetical protein